MNTVTDILKLAKQVQQQSIDAVLATVVHTEGSAYRRAGAMMLICEDGRSVGMISGGCLEPHIIKRAFWLTRNGASVQVYQTGDEQITNEDEEDSDHANYVDHVDHDELNFGLGCNGKVHVLFERLTTANGFLNLINHVREFGRPVTIATLIRCDNFLKDSLSKGSTDLEIGTRIKLTDSTLLDNKSYSVHDPIKQQLLAHKMGKKDAEYLVLKSCIEQKIVQSEWLIQKLQPQIRLLICGAGNDVMPLVTMAKLQDWHVTVIDSRAHYATRVRFPTADEVICLPLDDSEALLKLSANAAVAIMSHGLSQDRARLAVLLKYPDHYKYLGQLGPSYRTERLISEITSTTDNPKILDNGIGNLHYPIGYKLGGDGPEALALGIMAQMSAVVYDQALTSKESATTKAVALSNDLSHE